MEMKTFIKMTGFLKKFDPDYLGSKDYFHAKFIVKGFIACLTYSSISGKFTTTIRLPKSNLVISEDEDPVDSYKIAIDKCNEMIKKD